jgi:hypothetical protein
MTGAREVTAGDRFTRSVVVGALGAGRTVALGISLVLVWAGPALLWAGAATVTATLVLLAANRRVGAWLYGCLDAAVAVGAVVLLPGSRPVLILAIGSAAIVGATLGLRAAALWVPLLVAAVLVAHGVTLTLIVGVPVAGLASAVVVRLARPGMGKHAEEPSLRRMSGPLRVRVIVVMAAALVVGTAGAALGAHPSAESPLSNEAAAPPLDAGIPDHAIPTGSEQAAIGTHGTRSPSPSPRASPSGTPSRAPTPPPSTPPQSPVVSVAPPTSATAKDTGLACEVKYKNSSEWPGGFVANVTITDTGSSPITGWTLVFSYSAGQRLGSSWNASVSQSGSTVTATSNNKINAQGAATFGFQGTWQGTDPPPRSYTLNGTSCAVVT